MAIQQNQQATRQLSAEQVEIYRVVLNEEKAPPGNTNLNNILDPMAKGDDCLKGLGLQAPSDDSSKLTEVEVRELHVRLVDPAAQEATITNNDPAKSIRAGTYTESAVDTAFKTGLTTLSVIRFNPAHTTAAVSFSFHCGELCGYSKTLILKNTGGKWTISSGLSRRCSFTMS
jgi:hypothetical protein